jgi:hypothetical protein
MNVFFGPTEYRITFPRDSWKLRDATAYCTQCNDWITFVFRTGDATVNASVHQNPKAVKCRCFSVEGTARKPIPIRIATNEDLQETE